MKKPSKLLYKLILIFVIFGTIFATQFQILRQTANDDPGMLAIDTANAIEEGLTINDTYFEQIDALKSSKSFVIVYPKKGDPIAGSGYINKKIARLPEGVIEHAKPGKNHEVIWSPSEGKRFATVIVAGKDFYVVGAQSFENTEKRMIALTALTTFGLLVAVGLVSWEDRQFGTAGCSCDKDCKCEACAKNVDHKPKTAKKTKQTKK